MATNAVGDIHGCLPALVDLLDEFRTQIIAADRVVFLGDSIDRGPDTKRCMEAFDTIGRGVLTAGRLPDGRLFQSVQYEACRRDA